jgi:hypothetical protein
MGEGGTIQRFRLRPKLGMLLLLELDPATPVDVAGRGAFSTRNLAQKRRSCGQLIAAARVTIQPGLLTRPLRNEMKALN